MPATCREADGAHTRSPFERCYSLPRVTLIASLGLVDTAMGPTSSSFSPSPGARNRIAAPMLTAFVP